MKLKAFTLLCMAVAACNALAIPRNLPDGQLSKRGEFDCEACCLGACGDCCECFVCCQNNKMTPTVPVTHVLQPPEVQMITEGGVQIGMQGAQMVGNAQVPLDSSPAKAEIKPLVYETPIIHMGEY